LATDDRLGSLLQVGHVLCPNSIGYSESHDFAAGTVSDGRCRRQLRLADGSVASEYAGQLPPLGAHAVQVFK
jgi:hypothetical protein